ncbi:MAG: ribosome silencing factor [Candidatus Marinimicrobia bacterium]|nr:ribosome silencing factor [Candidatus Neomarinimicrobiota bacterium]|tara:strand:- start:1102 stop:1443 length:342 start_codon:yes stop_codon:yes gene_type:complete
MNKLIENIIECIKSKKGYDITILDVKKVSSLTDFFIICSSDSEPQTKAITNYIKKELSRKKIKPYQIDGLDYCDWVLMDYFDVVIHIFKKDVRDFYNIERLWGDAKIKKIKND